IYKKFLINLIFVFLLCFLIGLMQIFFTELLDKRVKDNEIISNLGWINLGTVNEMSPKELKETVLPVLQSTKESKTQPRVERIRLEEVENVRQTQEKVKTNES